MVSMVKGSEFMSTKVWSIIKSIILPWWWVGGVTCCWKLKDCIRAMRMGCWSIQVWVCFILDMNSEKSSMKGTSEGERDL